VTDATAEGLAELLRRLVKDGLPVIEFRREELRLEEAFVNILENNIAARSHQ